MTTEERDEVNRLIGRRIALRRKQLGWNQTEVAQHLGLTKPGYSHWETGENGVAAAWLPALARVLRCSAAYLLGEIETPTIMNASEMAAFRREMQPLAQMLRAQTSTLSSFLDVEEAENTDGSIQYGFGALPPPPLE